MSTPQNSSDTQRRIGISIQCALYANAYDCQDAIRMSKAVDGLERLISQEAARQTQELIDSVELPYPEDVFGELDPGEYSEIDEFAKTRGYRIDRISGTLMRRGWKVFKRQLQDRVNDLGLNDSDTKKGSGEPQ